MAPILNNFLKEIPILPVITDTKQVSKLIIRLIFV